MSAEEHVRRRSGDAGRTVERMRREAGYLQAGYLTAAAALASFGWLAMAVLRGQTLAVDDAVREAVHRQASPGLTEAVFRVTRMGSWEVLVPLSALLTWRLCAARRKGAAIVFLGIAAGAEVWENLLKLMFRRARPEAWFGYPQPASYSFPSGHAMVSLCFYGAAAAILTVGMRPGIVKALLWIAAGVLTGIIGFSRVYLGVHYPSDVAGGYLAGAAWLAAMWPAWLARERGQAVTPADSSG